MNIGHGYSDYGMGGYYREIDEADELQAREDRLVLQHRDTCRDIALQTVSPFALANGEDYYQTYGIDADESDWCCWLIDEAKEDGEETAAAMELLIERGADFTRFEWLEAQAAQMLPRLQAA